MPLQPGQRLGAYVVVAAIGAGGMGEVYRARDTKLHREIALKILPEIFAFDPDRLARFAREAQVLASLNHPNIAAIYGLEEADGVKALALELVDGPTLADRIAQGPIPVDEALAIARQIVDALEAAHEAGVVHRDLKPANVKVRPESNLAARSSSPSRTMDRLSMSRATSAPQRDGSSGSIARDAKSPSVPHRAIILTHGSRRMGRASRSMCATRKTTSGPGILRVTRWPG